MNPQHYEYETHCPFCQSTQTFIEYDIPIKESTEYGETTPHTVSLSQCKNCKMLLWESD